MSHVTGKKFAVLTTNGVEQAELTEPLAAIKDHGGTAEVVSPEEKQIQAMKGDWEHADHFDVDVQLSSADPADYDALVLPGGTANADALRMEEDAVALTRAMVAAGKPVAVICHGAWILTEADAVKGRRMTSYPSLKTDLRNAGATWVDEEVVVDTAGPLVSSRTPEDLPAFNRELVEAFAG